MADSSINEVLDGLQQQSANESISYSINTAPWGGSPTGPSHTVFRAPDFDTDIKGSVMSGTPSIDGGNPDQINLPALSGLTKGYTYWIFVQFTSGGNSLEGFFRVEAT